ncbi:MAG: hypothetical protein LBM68_01490 [Bacteroidales bacterium]|jgi:hypothetical protein|nr:hypothetical protein [Bacteroidales bacterium]
MKKTLICMLALLCAGIAFGQAKNSPQKIVVYVSGGEADGIGDYAGAFLVDAITHNGGYSAVERTADFLQAINKEQEYQRTGMVDDEHIARLGKQFGSKLVCVVKISTVKDKYFIQARLLDAETALVTNSTKPFLFTLEDLENVCNSIATQLLTEQSGSRTIQSAFGQ